MGSKTPLRKVKARYGAMTVFANDTGAATRSLLRYGEWAQQEIEFVTSLFDPGATVVDVGAYIGTHTLAFARRVGKTGLVLSFEAQPCSFQLLDRNVKANGLTQVRLHHAAVSDAAGIVEFAPIDPSRKASFGSASLAKVLRAQADAPSRRKASVATTTIDAFDLARCDLAKIDVEDSEDIVLKGAAQTIERCRPIIYAECNSVDAGVRVIGLLRSHGYKLQLHLPAAFNPANFARSRRNVFGAAREAAILGLPPERQFSEGRTLSADMLLPLETIDDLVLGLLNKPQYTSEVLAKMAALRLTAPLVIGPANALGDAANQLEAPQAAVPQAQALAAGYQEEIENLERRLRATHTALEDAKELVEGRQVEIAELRDRLNASQVARQSAQDLAIGSKSQIMELKDRLARTQAALDKLQSSAIGREAELAELKECLDEAKAALERAEARAAEQEWATDASRQKAEAAVLQASLARRSADRAVREATEYKAELERTQANLARAEAMGNAFKKSMSWRLTAPLRALARFVRGR